MKTPAPVNQGFASILATCEESKTGRLTPQRSGYFRMHVEDDGRLFLAFAPSDAAVTPIAVELQMDMTIQEAIEAIGKDGRQILEWAFPSS